MSDSTSFPGGVSSWTPDWLVGASHQDVDALDDAGAAYLMLCGAG